ncbi:RimJ/RimL family protein N-acetyltransferase [Litoreibacter ponti]|uniref:RimJ/RimL family protein N-acetyltransferase n=1 Tax=Litoreibacter ponti TaxID=1510457 RepID=A0A2T6BIZ0_9RHOB|nr:GNAT family protein [Litoreibacter ponti]PTX56024.1 RimJ/RimL family protein N-acetyltransferase [Litoreibacter ponti]
MQVQSKPVLKGARVTLRAPQPDDVAGRLALGNSPELHRLFGGDPSQTRALTEDAAQAWVDRLIGMDHGWVIEMDGRLIGSISLHSLNLADMRAQMAIGILDESCLGQGLGSEAMRVLAAHAFGTMKLHRLSLRVLGFNARAIAAYRKVGFREEGRERESALIAGVWHDDILMGLLSHELLDETRQ